MKKLIAACIFFVACGNNNDPYINIAYQDINATSQHYIVTYTANGAQGTPPLDTTIYAYNDEVTVLAPEKLYKEGYYFIGWSFCAECLEPLLKPGYTFTITSSTMLYACFSLPPVYSVIYYPGDADAGTPPVDPNYYKSGEKAYIKANTNLTKIGYRFAGWLHPSSIVYQPGQSITIEDSDVKLQAYFTPKPFTVTYHSNGATSGSVPVDTLFYDQGDTVIIANNTGNLAIINKDGISYCFDHWNDMPDGSGTNYYPQAHHTIQSSLQLYACYRPYSVGDTGPAGGIVFYIKQEYSDSWRYLEALPYDVLLEGIVWEQQLAPGQYRTTGATATEVGSGLQNTMLCIQVLGNGTYAAQQCNILTTGNFHDWYLPSKDELNLLYQQKAIIGNFTGFNYWSSSESTTSKAWYQNFNTGAQNTQYKNNSYRIRAIRQF